MTDDEVRVRDILGRVLKTEPREILPEQRLREDLGADSLDLIELLYEFEDAFGTRIPDEQAVDLKTVADVYRALGERRAA